MFKKTKKETPPSNSIVSGMSFTGDLEIAGDIRIDGTVIGSVKSTGKIIIGEEGKVKGDLGCEMADVAGVVEGTFVSEDLIILRDSAEVRGDIYAEYIECSEGAVINGNMNIGKEWKKELENEQEENSNSQNWETEEGGIYGEHIPEYTD